MLLLFVGTASLTSAQTRTIVSIDSPNGMTYNPDANFLCAANRDTDSVTSVHMGLLPVRWTVAVGHLPNGIAYNPASGHLYVANYGSDDVTVLDGSGGRELATIPVGSEPAMAAVNPNTNKVYVTLHGEGRLAVIDGVSDTLLTFMSADDPDGADGLLVFPKGWPEGFAPPYALDVGAIPREGIAVNLASDRVYVSARGDDQVAVVGEGEPACPPNFAVTKYRVEIRRSEEIPTESGE